ncbi:hypothetical protein AB6F20_14980 [Providencia hangzhouensis]|uniref:hypothetical protein n=1 Tax=Providencia hangzhouensis TaxID=3031799 RepID=UPI0034DD8D61
MQRTLGLDSNITNLYINAKKSQNNIEQLLRELNSNSLMHFNSNNTVDGLMKHTTELNTQYTKIKDLHNVFDQIKSSEYLDGIHILFKQYKDTQINYQESDYQNNKEFKLLTELNLSIKYLKNLKPILKKNLKTTKYQLLTCSNLTTISKKNIKKILMKS